MACQLKTMNKIAYKEERKVIKELNEIEGNPQGEEWLQELMSCFKTCVQDSKSSVATTKKWIPYSKPSLNEFVAVTENAEVCVLNHHTREGSVGGSSSRV